MGYEYKNLTLENQVVGYKNRIQQLEEEHFTNVVHAFEARLIDDKQSVEHFFNQNVSIERRIAGLTAEVDRLSELLANSEEEDDNH